MRWVRCWAEAATRNAGGFGPCGLIFVDSACPLLGQGAGLVAVAERRQCADRRRRAFCCQVVHNQFRRWGDDGDPVVGADGGDARIAAYLTCRGCQVLTDVEDSSAGRVDDRGVGGVVVVEPRGGPVLPEGNAVGCVLALVVDATPPPPRRGLRWVPPPDRFVSCLGERP